MANIKPEALRLMCNSDLIDLNQDKLHLQAYVADKQGECYIMVKDIKTLGGKERAVAVYNPSDEDQKVRLDPKTIDLGGAVQYYDCVMQAPYLYDQNTIPVYVPAHGTKIYKVKGGKRLERTRYEAETAWLSRYQELRNNQAENTAIYDQKEGAEGGYIVRFLGNSADNDLQWQHVNVKKGGTKKMTIAYYTGEEREMDMRMRLLQKLKSAIEKRAEAGELLPPAGPFEDDELATDENGEGAFLSGLPDDEDGEEAM
jgi:hypothetical protein